MLTFQDAESLAGAWVRITSGDEAALMPDATIAKPYGWVFFYRSATDPSGVLVGNAPILIDRVDGEIRVLGTAHPVQHYLSVYEQTLPPARLTMGIEHPS